MASYYNEIDPYAAQWLRNLIAKCLIAPGDVDERSILEVKPDDLKDYDQCHFFAGIGGWSYALRLAGWPDDRPVWTGSCPCQPFSAAGKQRGSDDERHLWPAFFDLIRECSPGRVFGEQVAGAAGLAWLDHVCADLEGAGYAAAAADLPACSVGAPHRRQRLFWVAHAERAERWPIDVTGQNGCDGQDTGRTQACGATGTCGEVCYLANAAPGGRRIDGSAPVDTGHAAQRDPTSGMADTDGRNTRAERQQRSGQQRFKSQDGGTGIDAWADTEWLECSDGKARPTQSGLFPLAHGVSNRVGRLRAYGNAIVPQVAAVFVMANADDKGRGV